MTELEKHKENIHGVAGAGLSGLCDIFRYILQDCTLIVQVLQDHITTAEQRGYLVSQQREEGAVHSENLTCLRVTQPQFLHAVSREAQC